MLESPRTLGAWQGTPGSAPYAEALASHAARDKVSLFVPGHGADAEGLSESQAAYFGEHILGRDVTPLLPGIDLGDESPRAEAMRLAADAWGARRTWFLTNGSTQANRMAALAVHGIGDDVVMQRSAHSSFVDGIILAGLRPGFITPSIDLERGINHGVTPQSVREAIEAHPGTPTAVYIVSPSYFGAVADIRGIAEVVHEAGAALIVDCAWGAHFGFHPALPESPARLGADVVVMSTHKLTGSLTQSAMIHLGETELADRLEPQLERAFAMTSSTSESSMLLASLDIARRDLVERRDVIDASVEHVLEARDRFRLDGRFPIVSDGFAAYDDIVAVDPFRIPLDITATGFDGPTVRTRLMREYGIHLEMATATCVVAVVGMGKSPDLEQLLDALGELAEESALARGAGAPGAASHDAVLSLPELPAAGPMRVVPREAFFGGVETVSAADAVGRVSVDSLAAYPPGIPNVLPGEEITAEAVEFLQAVAVSRGGHVRGAVDPLVATFRVLRED